MEHSLKPLLPKLLLITPLVALQPLKAQSVNNPYATYYTVLNSPLYLPNHPNFSLPSTAPRLNCAQSVPLMTEIEIKPVIKQPVIPLADARFNQWGEADLILRRHSPEKILPPSPEFSMVFPLFQEIDRFLLTQLSARHEHHGKQTIYSLGFGQRFWRLNQHHWWGTHLFYDHCPQGKHHRLGLAGEWQNSRARCTVNGYFPLSQWRLEEKNQLEKRPARSLDFHLQWFLFQKPCVNLNLLMEHAFSDSLVYPNQSATAPHPTALTFGLSYTPVSLVTIDYNAKIAHKAKPSHQLQIQFTYRLGISLAQQCNPVLATTGYDPTTNRLSLVHRQSTMLLEQREPPTSAEKPVQKPSESTPSAKQPAKGAVVSGKEAATIPQEAANPVNQQKSNGTADNLPRQTAGSSAGNQNQNLYPPLSPISSSSRNFSGESLLQTAITKQPTASAGNDNSFGRLFTDEDNEDRGSAQGERTPSKEQHREDSLGSNSAFTTPQETPIVSKNLRNGSPTKTPSFQENSPNPVFTTTLSPFSSVNNYPRKNHRSGTNTFNSPHTENIDTSKRKVDIEQQLLAEPFNQQAPNDKATNSNHQFASLLDKVQNPSRYLNISPKIVTTTDDVPVTYSQTIEDKEKRGASSNGHSGTSRISKHRPKANQASSSLSTSTRRTLLGNPQPNLSEKYSSLQETPLSVHQSSDPKAASSSQKTNASRTKLGTQETIQQSNTGNSVENSSKENLRLEEYQLDSDFPPTNYGNFDASPKVGQNFPIPERRTERFRRPPDRLSYENNNSSRKKR